MNGACYDSCANDMLLSAFILFGLKRERVYVSYAYYSDLPDLVLPSAAQEPHQLPAHLLYRVTRSALPPPATI
jgi:hypothetical protein